MSDALGGRRWAWIHLCKHPITDPLRYQRVDEREVLGHLLKVITYSWATIYCTSWQEENRMLWDRDDWGRSSSCVIIEQIFFYESCVTWAMFLMNGLYWQVWEGKCSLIQRIVQWRLMWICFPKYTQMKSSTYLTNADRAIHGMYHMAYGLDMCWGSYCSAIRRIVQWRRITALPPQIPSCQYHLGWGSLPSSSS